jgi:hypothetical protein
MTPARPNRGMPSLTALLSETVSAAHGHARLAKIRAAQEGILRSPGVDRLLRDYTDAMFRNTEAMLADIGITAS